MTMDLAALATVVVVPRQRFSATQRTLEALYANTPAPFNLVYVDAGSPAHVRDYLAAQTRERGFRVIRIEAHLSPNEARNVGIRAVTTKYVAFIDNDTIAGPNWLAALTACAERTGAWLVGPLVFIGEPLWSRVHIAGGTLRLEDTPTGRRLTDRHELSWAPYAAGKDRIEGRTCDFVEFHAMLARRDVFDRVGMLDERLLSAPEHLDLGLLVRQAGGTIRLEPAAHANYLPATRLALSDVPFYMVRWSDAWNRASLARLREKWALDPDDPFLAGHYYWLTDKRMKVLGFPWTAAKRLLGYRGSLWLARISERLISGHLVRRDVRRRAALQADYVTRTLTPA
jgi:GT2 family glycosyltransferase